MIRNVDELRAEVAAIGSDGAVRGKHLYGGLYAIDAAGSNNGTVQDTDALYVQVSNLDRDYNLGFYTPDTQRDLFVSHVDISSQFTFRANGWKILPGVCAHFQFDGFVWKLASTQPYNQTDMAFGLVRLHNEKIHGDSDESIGVGDVWAHRAFGLTAPRTWTISAPIVMLDDSSTAPTVTRYGGDSLLLSNDSPFAVTLDLTATGQGTSETVQPGAQVVLAGQLDGTWEQIHSTPALRTEGIADGAVRAPQFHGDWAIYDFGTETPTDTDPGGRQRYSYATDTAEWLIQLDNVTADFGLILTEPVAEGGRDLWLANTGAFSVYVYSAANLTTPLVQVEPTTATFLSRAAGGGAWTANLQSWYIGTVINDHGGLAGLADDDHTQYHTEARADTWFGTKSIGQLGTRSASDLDSGVLPDARIQTSGVTQHQASIDHDALFNFVPNEHLDWTLDQSPTDINAANIPDLSGTYATAAQGALADTAVQPARQVGTTNSLTGGGDLSADRTLSLVNDAASPGVNQVYGTDGAGTKGWKADPGGGGGAPTTSSYVTVSADATLSAERVLTGGTGVDLADGGPNTTITVNLDAATQASLGLADSSVQPARQVGTANSLDGGGDLSANRTLTLVNDVASPGINQVYGTDGAGTRGWKADPSGGGGAPTTASYVTVSAEAGLDAERVLTGGTGVDISDGGANSTATVALDSSTQTSLGLADTAVQSATAGYRVPVLSGVSGSLTTASHSGAYLIINGNITVPNAAGDVGFNAVVKATGGYNVTFNGTTSPNMANGDVMTIYVESTTVIVSTLTEAADLVTYT